MSTLSTLRWWAVWWWGQHPAARRKSNNAGLARRILGNLSRWHSEYTAVPRRRARRRCLLYICIAGGRRGGTFHCGSGLASLCLNPRCLRYLRPGLAPSGRSPTQTNQHTPNALRLLSPLNRARCSAALSVAAPKPHSHSSRPRIRVSRVRAAAEKRPEAEPGAGAEERRGSSSSSAEARSESVSASRGRAHDARAAQGGLGHYQGDVEISVAEGRAPLDFPLRFPLPWQAVKTAELRTDMQGELGVKVRVGLSLGLLVGAKVGHIYISPPPPHIPLLLLRRFAETVPRSSASRSRSSSRQLSTR